MSIDDESLRAIQAAGLIDEVVPDLMLDYGSDYLSPSGQVFARVRPETREYGFPRRNGFQQPVLEATLLRGLKRFHHVCTQFERTLVSVQTNDRSVVVGVQDKQGNDKAIRCGYLAGCDGAASTVRELVFKQKLRGLTYSQNWLIIDVAETKDPFHYTEVYCDFRRPGISLPGPKRTRRYELMMRTSETEEEVLDPGNITRMLASLGPDAYCDRVRTAVYRFHARVADRWHLGRVTLHGDAAHLTPPFAGQGMNSGVRDAFNYAWKVSATIKGHVHPKILETYETERKPHAWELIRMAIRMGRVMMPTNRLQGWVTRGFFRILGLYRPARDYIVQMKYKPKPRYRAGFFVSDQKSPSKTIVGRMFPQPDLQLPDMRLRKLDEMIGTGFSLLCLSGSPGRYLKNLDFDLGTIEVPFLCIIPQQYNFPDTEEFPYVRDHRGNLNTVFKLYMDHLVLLRPDRYVAAVIPPTDRNRTLQQIRSLFQTDG